MKAARINTYGGSDVIEIADIDAPRVSEGKVLVEVHAASLNPFDTTIRAGYMKDMIPLTFPVTLGGDIAGIVREVGGGVDNVAVGDKVFGSANVVAGNSGAFAELAVTSAKQVAKAPANVDFKQAAALPLVGVSAWQGLTQHIKLEAGQKLFVHGGAGGIGAVAIQLAKHLGAYVATTATGAGIDAVRVLGADEVIDYKAADFASQLSDYDAVFDTVGGDDFGKSYAILKRGGVAVSMIASADEAKAQELGITAISEMAHITTNALNELRSLVEAGVITARIGATFELDEVRAAFEAREGDTKGKVVLVVKAD